ncbi:hypothetical protein JXA34_03385 [Patescibacteria group bacterium]|nr:hypothetical protein [Patescibacteria group bacterium]
MANNKDRVKTTLLLDKTLKKLAQVYAIQNDKTLQAVVEEALRKMLLGENNSSAGQIE